MQGSANAQAHDIQFDHAGRAWVVGDRWTDAEHDPVLWRFAADGEPVDPGIVVPFEGDVDPDETLNALRFARNGDAWAAGKRGQAPTLVRLNEDGQVLARYAFPDGRIESELEINAMTVDTDGYVWMCGTGVFSGSYEALFWKVSDDGDLVDGFPVADPTGCNGLAFDPTGHVWAAGYLSTDIAVWRFD